ncbi:MAG: DNA adenine methylase [Pyrinomonadaceae bacterium]
MKLEHPVKHPVLKYYGSKFRLASWIISYFPEHKHYVEPFGGAANILLVKDPSLLETYNDLNSSLVNFFRVLRDSPDELIEHIDLTPWARMEYEYCLTEAETDLPVELARKLFFRLWMSISGQFNTCRGSWRRHTNGKRLFDPNARRENLINASKRLLSVQIENRDALKLIKELDSPETLFYLDPPYVFSTRTTSKAYSHEMTNDAHREFAELLYSLQGFVILSGYPSKIYGELFEDKGWQRVEREALVMGGAKRTECLWLSPQTVAAL